MMNGGDYNSQATRYPLSDTKHVLARYGAAALGVIAGLEWLMGRTVSRLAAAPNLDGTPRSIVEAIGGVGIDLFNPSFLLALMLLFLFALLFGARAVAGRDRWGFVVALTLCIFGAVVGVASLLPSTPWLGIVFNILSLTTLGLLALRCVWQGGFQPVYKTAVVVIVLGYTGWFLYVLWEGLPSEGRAAGDALFVLDLGEMALVAVPFLLFWAVAVPHKQWLRPARWVLPVVAMLLFSAANIADMVFDQGFTGVFSLWSVGYTLFLPWPLYALALGGFLYVVLTCFSRTGPKAKEANPNTGLAMLLFLFAGYNLQLTYQHLLAALAMVLLTGVGRPFGVEKEDSMDGEVLEVEVVGVASAARGKLTT